jgi:hypothetical protein
MRRHTTFSITPTDLRTGLVWESEISEPYFQEVLAPDAYTGVPAG